jgi:tripartite-type tricarboxylate transporter receptor subunit TctC
MRPKISTSAALLLLLAGPCAAQSGVDAYPTRPIRLIVPYAPGGGSDFVARIVALKMPELIGQNLVIDNRGGAAGLIGTEIAARTAPDGYTLLLADSALTINTTYYKNAKYDPQRDFAPITNVAETPYLVAVSVNAPWRTAQELVTAAKAQPGHYSFGSGGNGAGSHLTGELFQLRAGAKLTHVPYKGVGPALADMIAGQIPIVFTSAPPAMSLLKAGRMRTLGVATAKRSVFLPDVPTLSEQGIPVVVTNWYGIASVGATPVPVLDKLHAALMRIVAMPDVKERFSQGALEPAPMSREQFRRMIADDVKVWAEVVRSANLVGE